MTKNFQPILYTALVYIDDISVYSVLLLMNTCKCYTNFLIQFNSIGSCYMKRKKIQEQNHISFLSMDFANVYYSLGSHIDDELQKFPNQNLTNIQIQQFFGIVNYVRDFISLSASLMLISAQFMYIQYVYVTSLGQFLSII